MIYAYARRTKMIGGGNAYDVYFRCQDKPSAPLHNGHEYATTIMAEVDGVYHSFYSVMDAIGPRSWWAMDAGMDKYDEARRIERIARRLALRIARRVFPELVNVRELPLLWIPETDRESMGAWVPVNMTLPE